MEHERYAGEHYPARITENKTNANESNKGPFEKRQPEPSVRVVFTNNYKIEASIPRTVQVPINDLSENQCP